jgi:hypothetical protein
MFPFEHASAVEILLWIAAVGILGLVVNNLRRVHADHRNLVEARRISHPDLISPLASLESVRGAIIRKRHDLAMSIVFVALTTLGLMLAPPPPGGFWQISFGKVIIAIGLCIIGSSSRSAVRTRERVQEAIHEDDRARRRIVESVAHHQ